MAKETLNTRVTRLEESMQALVDAQIKTEERFQQTEERFQQIARQFEADHAEARERERRVDERIEKLVSAIGELIRRNGK
jgi:predicted  nucleic acid-binding Zn-ribbon protein